MRAAFLMLVASGEGAMAVDTTTRALSLYPDSCLVARDDASEDGTFEKLQQLTEAFTGRIVLDRNPRKIGLCAQVLSMFPTIQRAAELWPDAECFIKLDPDTLMLRGGLVEIARKKFAEHGPGMIGSYRIGPDGGRRRFDVHTRSILKDLLAPRPIFWRKTLIRAMLHGYIPGDNVLGGLYILHGETVRRALALGLWAVPHSYNGLTYLEDPLVSMVVRATGHHLIEINNSAAGDVPACIFWRCSDWDADQISRAGYLAIHPVKDSEGGQALRERLPVRP